MGKDDVVSSSPSVEFQYHLGLSAHPGLVTTPVNLEGPNYNEWVCTAGGNQCYRGIFT